MHADSAAVYNDDCPQIAPRKPSQNLVVVELDPTNTEHTSPIRGFWDRFKNAVHDKVAAQMYTPRIAITIGDVAGIGPEVALRACVDSEVRQRCRPTLIGHPEVIRRAAASAGIEVEVDEVDDVDERVRPRRVVACWNPAGDDVLGVSSGALDAAAGRAAYDYLVAAARAALDGRADAITTAPLNKVALAQAGLDYPGHTEILAELCGVERFAMMLFLPAGPGVKSAHGLGVAHVTLHTAIANVPGLLSKRAVGEKIELLNDFMKQVGCDSPRIGVCALNPHGGEQGRFGDEEQRIIAPAVDAARDSGIDASGPWPADTLLKRAIAGEFDAVAAMYHDQGHIAIKLIGFDCAVNVTLGLPIVRTSPSHGTAFDIAGRGLARADGMREALKVAAKLSLERHPLPVAAMRNGSETL